MNKLERIVYDLVKGNPRLKIIVRNIYQTLFDLLPDNPDKNNYTAEKMISKSGYFFGFHDLSPFSQDEKKILSNKLEITLRMPVQTDPLTVGFWNEDYTVFNEVTKTYAWNYHKGCRLQWLGKSNDNFVFNSVNSGKLGATIYNISGDKFQFIDYPIDTVSPNGCYATSFSYERLQRYMPGYGYCHPDEPYFNEDRSEKTGLFLIDLKKNQRQLIVPLSILASVYPEESMKSAKHYVTHTEFSPDGDRIAFLHRWIHDDVEKRWTRLVTCKLDGSEMFVSPTTGMVSHYDWDEKHGIVAYCQINGIDGHYIFSDYSMKNVYRVGSVLNSDGHQSYIPNSDCFVTDTYPDKRRYAKLYIVNIEKDKTTLIANLKSPKKYQSPTEYKHWACDLHPRVSPSGKYVSFDSVYNNERNFCIMDISNLY
jgi:hypothetical protein